MDGYKGRLERDLSSPSSPSPSPLGQLCFFMCLSLPAFSLSLSAEPSFQETRKGKWRWRRGRHRFQLSYWSSSLPVSSSSTSLYQLPPPPRPFHTPGAAVIFVLATHWRMKAPGLSASISRECTTAIHALSRRRTRIMRLTQDSVWRKGSSLRDLTLFTTEWDSNDVPIHNSDQDILRTCLAFRRVQDSKNCVRGRSCN